MNLHLPTRKTGYHLHNSHETIREGLLVSGMVACVLYVVTNIITTILYKGYDPFSQTVSELSAIGTPTRALWIKLVIPYSLLMSAFGIGVWESAGNSKNLRTTALLLMVYAITGLLWPPMHQREVLADGGKTFTDNLHILFTVLTVAVMMVMIGFASTEFDNRFRIYSVTTLILLSLIGSLTGIKAANIEANAPTPWLGILERVNIAIYLAWITVFAATLLHKKHSA